MNDKAHRSILVAGGDEDPHLDALIQACRERSMVVETVLIGAQRRPRLHWDFDSGTLLVDDRVVRPAAAFLRHDVFSDLRNPDPNLRSASTAWYATLAAYLQLARIPTPNLGSLFGASSKIVTLARAREHGLPIPNTSISNDGQRIAALHAAGPHIAKPVNGGSYTQSLEDLLPQTVRRDEAYAAPAFVQRTLRYPEYRVFVVGEKTLAFQIDSDILDYRSSSAARVVALSHPPAGIEAPLLRLCADLDLQFAAADFKSGADGEPVFLELNDAPMFAGFDQQAGGALIAAMLDWLQANARGAGRDATLA